MTTQIIPRCPITVRIATAGDVPFMDRLQKLHGKALGYFPTKQFEGYVQMGGVLIAQEAARPVGYCISRDRYLKRDELGVIYQLCVAGTTQRKLVGATLIKEVFERSAYGCKLYCCWCAQDLDANYFWESLGFVPVAFRAGSKGKKRVHIFWQRRIGAEDVATPYWYPFQTNAGAIRQDRIVFPIPPGVHWKDVEAVTLPGTEKPKLPAAPRRAKEPKAKRLTLAPPPGKVAIIVSGRIKYVDRPGYVAPEAANEPAALPARKQPKPKLPAEKIDPKYLTAARELRDRYLEQFNSGLVLPQGKYEVSRTLSEVEGSRVIAESIEPAALPLLKCA